METRYVNVKSLNFRKEPSVVPETLLATLHLGQAVQVKGPAENKPGWLLVNVEINEKSLTGYVSEKFLRLPVSNEREVLIAQAIHEWTRFQMGKGKENQAPYFEFVGEMWEALRPDLDGTDREVPWSAAAISFMVRNAGQALGDALYPKFRFSAAHARYINDSITKRDRNDPQTPFWGYPLGERKPQLGDLVCRSRAGQALTYEFARTHHQFKSHCDLIVAMSENSVIAIGGNVSNSVSTTTYDLTTEGFLKDTKGVFTLLANNYS